MAPSTFAGFAFFAASLGPGFVYLRVAERRRPRAQQSPLAEAVEMVVLGAALSLICATGVVALAKGLHWMEWASLIEHPKQYVAHHPFRLVGPLAGALLLSYLAAFGLGLAMHARSPKVVQPSVTMWQQALWLDQPSSNHSTIATVELRDGRKVVGMVRGFTVQQSEHRELLLAAPLAVVRYPGAKPEKLTDAFMVIREDDLAYVAGNYWPPPPTAEEPASSPDPPATVDSTDSSPAEAGVQLSNRAR